MTENSGAPQPIPLIAPVIDSAAPVIFADFLAHCSVTNGVTRLSFAENLGEPLDAVTSAQRTGWHARYCATVMMPVVNLPFLVEYLTNILEGYRAQGILPPKSAPDGE